MAARVNHPGLTDTNIVLPTVILNDLPVWFGVLGLAAIFSAEVNTRDTILFMLSTSISKDVYQRFVDRTASPDQVLRIARITAVTGGVIGMFMAIQLSTVADALRIFYSLVIATLFVPVVGGPIFKRAGASHALVAIACGIGTLLAVDASYRPPRLVGPGHVGTGRQRDRVRRDVAGTPRRR